MHIYRNMIWILHEIHNYKVDSPININNKDKPQLMPFIADNALPHRCNTIFSQILDFF